MAQVTIELDYKQIESAIEQMDIWTDGYKK